MKSPPLSPSLPPEPPIQQSWGGVPPAHAFDHVRRYPPPIWEQEKARKDAQQAQQANSRKKKKKKSGKTSPQKPANQTTEKSTPVSTGKRAVSKRRRKVNPARRRRQRRMVTVLAIVVLIATGAWFSISVLFKINKYEVQGEGVFYSEDEIIEAFGHALGDNLYGFSVTGAEERLMTKLPYIEVADIRRRPPSTVIFRLTMAQETYYLPWEGAFVVMNPIGKVLRIAEQEPSELVRIDGLSCVVVEPGTPIRLDEAASEEAVLTKKREQEASAASVSAESGTSEVSAAAPEEEQPVESIAESVGEAPDSVADGADGSTVQPEPEPEEPTVASDPALAAESFDVLWTLMKALDASGLEGIRWLDVGDPLELRFNWQDRITVRLGPKSGIEEKLKALRVLLTDPDQGLEEGDRGTIDMTLYLSTGECVFTPE